MFNTFPDFVDRINQLKRFKVIKYERVLQSLMYFLQVPREKICEPGTNKFNWKIAKNQINENLIKNMEIVRLRGPKHTDFTKYQTLNFIEKNIANIEESDVFEYNMMMGRLFRWLKQAFETRKMEIVRRWAISSKEKEDRDVKIKLKEEREKKRENELQEAIEKFTEDHKDEIDVYEQWKAK